MRVGIPKETWPGEARVAVIPAGVAALKKAGLDVAVETGAGAAAGLTDDAYRQQGAAILSAAELVDGADILLTVRATPPGGKLHAGQAVIGRQLEKHKFAPGGADHGDARFANVHVSSD